MKISTYGILIMSLLLWAAGFAKAPNGLTSEQSHFSAEDASVAKPVPLPDQVKAILQKDPLVLRILENEGLSGAALPVKWFSASEIHLSTMAEKDLIVVGEPPLAGGNTAPFWIFVGTSSGFTEALSCSAHDLTVKSQRWKGYREVELSGPTASELFSNLYRFNGNRYVIYHGTAKPIG